MTAPDTHWDAIFSSTEDQKLGWHEADTSQTMKFVQPLLHGDSTGIFIPGAGTSPLVPQLLASGCRLILNDISSAALNRLRQQLGDDPRLHWLHQDIAQPLPADLPPVDLWIDRAVLHFLTDEAAIDGYFRNLARTLRPGGHVLLAEFSTDGAEQCAGLPVHRYSLQEYDNRLGDGFELLRQEAYRYINPFGEARPYLYALYRKRAEQTA